jgi:predicted amidohydrolase
VTTRVAAVQMEPKLMDRQGNLSAVEAGMRRTAEGGAKLAIFPEVAITGYCFESLAEAMPYAEAVPGETVERLQPLCRELDQCVIVGTLERAGDKLFNAALLIGPDGLIGGYRKVHLPFLGIDRFASHGDRPFAVHEAAGLRVGMLICYDGAFPEAVRCLSLAGADLIALPTNWPPKSECAAEHATNTRAWENNVYFAAVNRVGQERGFRFIGGSRIADPAGQTIASAPSGGAEGEAILYADIDPQRARNKHLVRVPDKHWIDRTGDRRPEMYSPIVTPVAKPTPRR